MAHPDQTSFRFKEGQRDKLEKIAAANGEVEVSQLIRWAIDALINHVERHGGRLHLPVDFSETVEVVTPPKTKLLTELTRKAG